MSSVILPRPGSAKAVSQGCTCAVLDNAHGAGYMGIDGVFVFTSGCKVHGAEVQGEIEWEPLPPRYPLRAIPTPTTGEP